MKDPLKPRDKITQKMTRDGLVEVNETRQTAERVSSRERDADFSGKKEPEAPQGKPHRQKIRHDPREQPQAESQKPPEPQKPEDTISKLITRRVVSVASQIVFVLRSLWKKRHVSLKELFRGKNDPSERVAAFLAVLELVKDKRLRVDGDGEDCEIKLTNGGE